AGAISYFEQARDLSARLQDNFYIAITLRIVGDHFEDLGEHLAALGKYREALSLLRRTRFTLGTSQALRGMGRAYIGLGRHDEARSAFSESLELAHQIKDEFEEANTLYELAQLDTKEGRLDDAYDKLRSSISIIERLRSFIYS